MCKDGHPTTGKGTIRKEKGGIRKKERKERTERQVTKGRTKRKRRKNGKGKKEG